MNEYSVWIPIILISIFSIIIYKNVTVRKNYRNIRFLLENRWGNADKNEDYVHNFKNTRSYLEYWKKYNKEKYFFIDDITWNDLEMDEIFKRMDYTLSTVGEEYLYGLIRRPIFSSDEFTKRESLIAYFQSNKEERLKVQMLLRKIGKKQQLTPSEYIFDPPSIRSNGYLPYLMLDIILLTSAISIPFLKEVGMLATLACFITNIIVYTKTRNQRSIYIDSISYLVNMINCAKKIQGLKLEELREQNNRIEEAAKNLLSNSVRSFYIIMYNTGDIILEYLKTIFLLENIFFERIKSRLFSNKERVKAIYEVVGYIDACISIASYRESIDEYVIPELYEYKCRTSDDSADKIDIIAEGVVHPLIEDAVKNSIEIEHSILITGSNATGKSTFLKTLAINSIFAQTICTCMAAKYKSPFVRQYSSMALRDNIKTKESYFMVEIKSLRRILEQTNEDIPCYCFIDEVLRGTNTLERISASAQILKQLSLGHCICVAATHDIELTYIVESYFENFHFSEKMSENDVIFDYTLYKGRSYTRNAIKLLAFLNYDKKLVDNAEGLAHDFETNGRWSTI